jgi:hypothetical protein
MFAQSAVFLRDKNPAMLMEGNRHKGQLAINVCQRIQYLAVGQLDVNPATFDRQRAIFHDMRAEKAFRNTLRNVSELQTTLDGSQAVVGLPT